MSAAEALAMDLSRPSALGSPQNSPVDANVIVLSQKYLSLDALGWSQLACKLATYAMCSLLNDQHALDAMVADFEFVLVSLLEGRGEKYFCHKEKLDTTYQR